MEEIDAIVMQINLDEMAMAFMCIPPHHVHPFLLYFASRHARQWKALLGDASVEFVEFLTEVWENEPRILEFVPSSTEYYEAMYACFDGDEQNTMPAQLLVKKEAFAAQCFAIVISETFGQVVE